MNRAPWLLAVATSACAVTLAFFYLAGSTSSSGDVRGPLEVAAAFVYHIDRGNFGKACGLYAPDARVDIETCSEGFVVNAAQAMMFGGFDVFEGARLVPGSRVDNPDGTVTFKIETDEIPPARLTLELQASGRWRISGIG